MYGQWIGTVKGSAKSGESIKGNIILNIDKDRPFSGVVQIAEYDNEKPHLVANVSLKLEDDRLTGKMVFENNTDPNTSSSIVTPDHGALSLSENGNQISGSWSTNIGTSGTSSLTKHDIDTPNKPDEIYTWPQFKEWAITSKLAGSNYVYRGHSSNLRRLKTSFHRTGRFDLYRYANNDVLQLARHISAGLSKPYKVDDSVEHGALLYLAQHHGFPTPLLDWTESPYIAAFFAFSKLPKTEEETGEYIRIYVFDMEQWHKTFPRARSLREPWPYLSFQHLSPIGNDRALPQQSITSSTNIYEIETFIKAVEDDLIVDKCLYKFDISAGERDSVMQELQYMGITHASLFPGIDGVCLSLRERLF